MTRINDISDPRLVKALAHPLRVQIMQTLAERIASPSELAEEIGVPLPNLSYHIRQLVSLDLITLVKTRPRRGAIEHYYKARSASLTKGAVEQLPAEVRIQQLQTRVAELEAEVLRLRPLEQLVG